MNNIKETTEPRVMSSTPKRVRAEVGCEESVQNC